MCQRCVSQHGVRLRGVRTENRKRHQLSNTITVLWNFRPLNFFTNFSGKTFILCWVSLNGPLSLSFPNQRRSSTEADLHTTQAAALRTGILPGSCGGPVRSTCKRTGTIALPARPDVPTLQADRRISLDSANRPRPAGRASTAAGHMGAAMPCIEAILPPPSRYSKPESVKRPDIFIFGSVKSVNTCVACIRYKARNISSHARLTQGRVATFSYLKVNRNKNWRFLNSL